MSMRRTRKACSLHPSHYPPTQKMLPKPIASIQIPELMSTIQRKSQVKRKKWTLLRTPVKRKKPQIRCTQRVKVKRAIWAAVKRVDLLPQIKRVKYPALHGVKTRQESLWLAEKSCIRSGLSMKSGTFSAGYRKWWNRVKSSIRIRYSSGETSLRSRPSSGKWPT